MEIKHKEIIESILNKKVKDRKEWEHQFLLKHKFDNDVRRYLLSMGEFKDVEIKEDETTQKVLCHYCNKPVHIDEAVIETEKGEKGLKISHVKCRLKRKEESS